MAALHVPAAARTIGTAGPWTVLDGDDACGMQATLRDQTTIALTMSKGDPRRAQLRLAHPNWQSLAQQPKIRVSVAINGSQQRMDPVPTFSGASGSGMSITFGTARVQRMFALGATIWVAYRSTDLLIWTLNDSTAEAAFQTVRHCAGDNPDPFAK